jgi:hypothetical protein
VRKERFFISGLGVLGVLGGSIPPTQRCAILDEVRDSTYAQCGAICRSAS